MPEPLAWFIGIAVTLALGLLTWQATRRSGDRQRIVDVEARVNRLEGRDMAWQNYTSKLRKHISDGSPPPPPDYPPELMT